MVRQDEQPRAYRRPSDSERHMMESRLLSVIAESFDELVDATWTWLQSPSTREIFVRRQRIINVFFEESGIREQWDEIVQRHARQGVDIVSEIYEYTRKMNLAESVIHYTPTERMILNNLADSSYELIRNVSEDQVRGIRRHLVQDYAEGENPRRTSLKEIQLEPINGWSPETRAEVIARTETARIINTGLLETYRQDGVGYVEFLASGNSCDECSSRDGKIFPVSEAVGDPCIHPNCTCTYIPARDPETGHFTSF